MFFLLNKKNLLEDEWLYQVEDMASLSNLPLLRKKEGFGGLSLPAGQNEFSFRLLSYDERLSNHTIGKRRGEGALVPGMPGSTSRLSCVLLRQAAIT